MLVTFVVPKMSGNDNDKKRGREIRGHDFYLVL